VDEAHWIDEFEFEIGHLSSPKRDAFRVPSGLLDFDSGEQGMAELKGNRLLVNLGASQVRRKLKGHGHGVRQIQAVGRNQSVVIHTATGAHLQNLIRLLAPFAERTASEGETAEESMGDWG